MEAVALGAGILFVLWPLGRMMDQKLRSIEEVRHVQTMDRSPEAVARMLMADLKRAKINQNLMNRLPPKATQRYLQESFLALASAQMLAIDQDVLKLDLRGPLIGSFRKQCPAELQERFEVYKRDFTQQGDVSNAFAEFLGLVGHEKLAVNLAPFNDQFVAIYSSSRNELRKLGLSG